MSKFRFVLDTNLIVSAALLGHSVPRLAFELALRRGEALMSDAMQLELSEVLRRKKFDRYLAEEKRLRFLASLVSLASPVVVTEKIDASRDPKDNMVLELAVCGKADCIATGDGDLLALNPFRGIPIVTPADFLMLYAEKT